MRAPRHAGFTLLELLVALAILVAIALLSVYLISHSIRDQLKRIAAEEQLQESRRMLRSWGIIWIIAGKNTASPAADPLGI